MEIETKKSYNPFKMWGSWVGIILGITLGFVATIVIASKFRAMESINQIFWPVYISVIIGSFLISWGIHSLVRKSRN